MMLKFAFDSGACLPNKCVYNYGAVKFVCVHGTSLSVRVLLRLPLAFFPSNFASNSYRAIEPLKLFTPYAMLISALQCSR